MAGGDAGAWRLAVLLQATLPGAPCIYYGNEVGVEGDHDPDCRRAFPWDESVWDVEGLAWTRAVLALRHATAALRRGTFRVAGAAGDALAFVRDAGEAGGALVAVNAGDGAATVDVWAPELAGRTLTMASLPGSAAGAEPHLDERGAMRIEVPARSGLVAVVRG
jgi:neopullulanase